MFQLGELLDKVASDPALFQADTNCHTHLWREEGLGTGGLGGGRKGNIVAAGGRSEGLFFSFANSSFGGGGGSGGVNTLSLKAKACTPSVYRYVLCTVMCN